MVNFGIELDRTLETLLGEKPIESTVKIGMNYVCNFLLRHPICFEL